MDEQTSSDRLAYRPREAARLLGISQRTLYAWTVAGKVPHLRIGQGKRVAVLYPAESLRDWLRQAAGQPASTSP